MPDRATSTSGVVLLAALFAGIASPSSLAAQDAPTEVFVVGTLYRRHATTPAYGLPELKRLIEQIDPDVPVLDVTPDELRKQEVHASKIEYPGVIFPLLNAGRLRAYASEPPEPMFSEIVQGIIAENEALVADKPDVAAAVAKLREATFEALGLAWTSPAAVHSETTDEVFRGMKALQGALTGPAERDGWRRWNRHHADIARTAVRENPGKRVLQLVGIENRYAVLEHLRAEPGVRVVDVGEFLRTAAASSRGGRA